MPKKKNHASSNDRGPSNDSGVLKKATIAYKDDRVVVFCEPFSSRPYEWTRGIEANDGTGTDVSPPIKKRSVKKSRSTSRQTEPKNNQEKSIETKNSDDKLMSPVSNQSSTGHTDFAFSDSFSGSFDLLENGFIEIHDAMGNGVAVETPVQQRKDPSNKIAYGWTHHVKHRFRVIIKEVFRFKTLILFQVLFAVYIAILTFADMGPPGGLRQEGTGYLVDEASPERTDQGIIRLAGSDRAIVAFSSVQVACVGLARISAWFMYPTLIMVFISKFRATQTYLSKSPLSMHMNTDTHELHVYCGWTIVVCSVIHASSHIARWALQNNLSLLVTHFSGISGLVIITSCFLICIPMTLFRKQIRYEVRKRLHYFFLLFAGALAFHTPRSAVPNGGFTFYVFGGLLIWYAIDATYCCFVLTEKIETTRFRVLPSGVRMTMEVSERFQKVGAKGGICYVCLPWISKEEWHPFSIFEDPNNPAARQIFIQKSGDWTQALHKHTQRETVRPAWVQGPFPSPYSNAASYDNQILVASGIGITPALSVIGAHKRSRRINLIWAVRDPHLLEFFLRHMYLDHEGWNLIFYTGKVPLDRTRLNVQANTNLCIINSRPKLHEVIPNIVFGVESRQGLPETYTTATREVASEMIADRLIDFSRSGRQRQNVSIAEDLACYASELGFRLPPEQVSENLTEASRGEMHRSPTKKKRARASKELMASLSMDFRPWENIDGAKEYVKKLDQTMILPTWGILYCGGAKMVLADLDAISEEYNIGLHVESFDW